MYGSQIATIVWSSGAHWGGVVVELHRIVQVAASEFHVHEHTVVLHRGSVTSMEIDAAGEDRCHTVQPGEVSVFSSGPMRRVRFGCSEQLMLTLTPEFIARAMAGANAGSPPELIDRYALNDPQVVHIATALEAEAAAGYPSGRVYGESMGVALTGHLITHHSSSAGPVDNKGGMSPRALRRVLRYIDDHLAEEIRLYALAEVASLSPHRFAHNFKQTTGLPPLQFVIHRRIDAAKPLLRDTAMTMATMTYALGFGSPSRFAQLFRRETGLTPTRYRALFR